MSILTTVFTILLTLAALVVFIASAFVGVAWDVGDLSAPGVVACLVVISLLSQMLLTVSARKANSLALRRALITVLALLGLPLAIAGFLFGAVMAFGNAFSLFFWGVLSIDKDMLPTLVPLLMLAVLWLLFLRTMNRMPSPVAGNSPDGERHHQ